jgi:hypothetical protein
MNNSLRGEVLEIIETSIVEWKHGGPKCVDEILNLIASKMPEKKYILHLTGNEFREAKGFNDCLAKVKSILKGEKQ